jgi:putative tryptophan/tyrosine transport system substrate-binding protein
MNRRAVIALIGAAAASSVLWPLVARAQQSDRMRRIGVLMNNAEDDAETKAQLGAFRQGLQQLGWSEGRNIHIDILFAADRPERYQALAKELVARQPDAIFAYTTPIAVALQRETRTTPIVFAQVSDPVGSGLVASLAHPHGNLTGFLLYEAGITGKWAAMLKEVAPSLKRVALLANPKTTPYEYFVRSAEAVAQSLAIELVPNPIESAADIEHAIAAFAGAPDGGLLILPSGTTTLHRDLVVALATKHRLPAVYPFRFYATAGGLMSYSTDLVDQSRQAAMYVDRILRGANPAELPVQAPTKFVTTVNLQTAKALGLEVPPSLLVRADEVIE